MFATQLLWFASLRSARVDLKIYQEAMHFATLGLNLESGLCLTTSSPIVITDAFWKCIPKTGTDNAVAPLDVPGAVTLLSTQGLGVLYPEMIPSDDDKDDSVDDNIKQNLFSNALLGTGIQPGATDTPCNSFYNFGTDSSLKYHYSPIPIPQFIYDLKTLDASCKLPPKKTDWKSVDMEHDTIVIATQSTVNERDNTCSVNLCHSTDNKCVLVPVPPSVYSCADRPPVELPPELFDEFIDAVVPKCSDPDETALALASVAFALSFIVFALYFGPKILDMVKRCRQSPSENSVNTNFL